ncbi:MAG: Cache domain protein [Methanoregulaceae archaeon PtaB.Bin152]|nr:MAG: Cache domain protein [Methanoregulaceae archaeon PtaB.Bin152]OPY39239.1 MAG: Cache domain protein [Methanoregulaceae archaeon PtaU1.Bin066]
MKVRILLLLLVMGAVLLASGCITPQKEQAEASAASAALTGAVKAIDADLAGVQALNLASANRLSRTGLVGPAAETALREKLDALPWALSSVTISPEGIIVAAVPEHYREIVGRDVKYQGPVQEALAMKVPRVSEVFMMEEGFAGISQSAPVFSSNGTYLGYTDVTYRPETLIERAIGPVVEGTPFDIWVTQTDGTVIYDTTQEEIGKNLFLDPVYQEPGLQEFFRRVVSEPSGTGSYRFWDRGWDREIEKEASWETAGIDGAAWRVVLTEVKIPPGSAAASSARNASLAELKDLDAYVQSAVAYAASEGREAAIREFNDPVGRFVEGDLYIFAYDMNGTVYALPFQQGLVGQNRIDVHDVHGVAFIRALVGAASRGGGHVYYVYPNPAAGFAEELKISSVVPVDDSWFLGSGIYLSHVNATFSRQEKDALMQRVHAARDFARQEGMAAALASFNDLSGQWAPGGNYIFAYAMNGTTLALPHQPELIGTSRIGFLDHYGVAIIDWEIEVARAGGGFVYVVYLNPDTGSEALKLCYVVPVDEEWFVGSGVYGPEV